MVNSDLASQYPAPRTDPTSGGSIHAGCGDDALISVRKITDGVVGNAEVLNDFQLKPDGAIFVGNCSLIAFWFKTIDLGTGPLTEILILPRWSVVRGAVEDQHERRIVTAMGGSGKFNLDEEAKLGFTTGHTTGGANFIIPNPCANWMYIYTLSVGTDTGSSMEIEISRGWGIRDLVVA